MNSILDMTFTNDGNSTVQEASGLINFEKMHLLAQTLRTLRFCRGRQLCKSTYVVHFDYHNTGIKPYKVSGYFSWMGGGVKINN